MAKFNIPRLRQLLMQTGSMYLLDKEDIDKVHKLSETSCILYTKPKKNASSEEKNAYDECKNNKCRAKGILVGKNRMGRFLMAVRSELRMMDIVRN